MIVGYTVNSYICSVPYKIILTEMKRSYTFKFLAGLLFIVLLFNFKAKAQFNLSITQCEDSAAVVALIDTVFLDGVNPAQIKNIRFTGDPRSVGYYNGGWFFGFQGPQGIVMSSGFAGDLDKSNNCAQ